MGPEILYFQVPKSHCCHWSADYILRSQSIMESVLGTKKEVVIIWNIPSVFFGLLAEDTFIAVFSSENKVSVGGEKLHINKFLQQTGI